MTIVNSRQSFKDYCMRRLGFPVIDINIDDDQVDDRIDDALQFFQDFHYDATQKVYISHYVSQTDITNKYIDLSQISGTGSVVGGANTVNGFTTLFNTELGTGQVIQIGSEQHTVAQIIDNTHLITDAVWSASQNTQPITNVSDSHSIMGVTKVFPLGSTGATVNMFDLRYQMRLHELFDFTSTSYVNFVLTQQHLRTLEMFFTGEQGIRFNRTMNRLYIDTSWGNMIQAGSYILAETYKIVNPDNFPLVYNDRYLKAYATALLKRQWGANLSKFGGVALLGGVTLNGPELFKEANDEVLRLEEQIQDMFQLPAEFILG